MERDSAVRRVLDELRPKLEHDWPVKLTVPESELLVGLRKLEEYTSLPVAAWLGGAFSVHEFAELADSALISNIMECADYIGIAMQSVTFESLQGGWHTTCQLLRNIRGGSVDGLELAKKSLVLFFTSIALRIEAESLLGGDSNRATVTNEDHIGESFFLLASTELENLGLPIDLSATPTAFLQGLNETLRATGWLEPQ